MSSKTSTRTEQIYVFITIGAEGEVWDPVKLASAPTPPAPTAPPPPQPPVIYYWPFQVDTFI